MKAKVFFFLILIAMGVAVVVCRTLGCKNAVKCIDVGPVSASTECLKVVFSGR